MGGDIYSQIFDADKEVSGFKTCWAGEWQGPADCGHVEVNKDDPENLIQIKWGKKNRRTYELVEKLFDNYSVCPYHDEVNTQEEHNEILALLKTIIHNPPMLLAKKWVEEQTGRQYANHEFGRLLYQLWFEQYDMDRKRDLSGFEHTIVGESGYQGSVGGYHFWYKYWIDDGRNEDGVDKSADVIEFLKDFSMECPNPDYVAMAFQYLAEKSCPLKKGKGGFWIGVSIEGLLALGTVAFFDKRSKIYTTLNGNRYKLILYKSDDMKHVRSFYPLCTKKYHGKD